MKRVTFLKHTSGAAAALSAAIPLQVGAAEPKVLQIAEPFHNIQYLPLYVGITQHFFDGLDVQSLTLQAGSSSTNAVLTGRVWGFIGGPEHNAFANTHGGKLRAISGVVDRGPVYFVARKGITPPKSPNDLKEFLRGKNIATSAYGGSLNSLARYLISKLGLDVKTDVNLLEIDNAAVLIAMQQGKADLANMTEPILSRGIGDGIWGEPFYSYAKQLGPFANSTINVLLETIEKDPQTGRAFVEGMQRALAYVHDHHEETMTIAATHFPGLPIPILRSSIQRMYDDGIWGSGFVTPAAIKTTETIAIIGGVLKAEVPYSDLVDMRFINRRPAGVR